MFFSDRPAVDQLLACKTLLLAPTSHELEDLGFIPNKHFVPISQHDFQQKANYYLRHDAISKRIAQNGFEMVRKKHSTKKRVQQFLHIVKNIIHQERREK